MKLYPGTIKRRLLAAFIDYLILSTVATFYSYFFVALPYSGSQLGEKLLLTFYIIGMVPLWFYPVICEVLADGETVGKRCMGLRVVRTDGSPVTPAHSLQRFLMLNLSMLTLGLIDLMCCLMTKRCQRLGDIVADTMVVWKAPSHYALCSPGDYYLPPGYTDRWTDIEYALTLPDVAPSELAGYYRELQTYIAEANTHNYAPELVDYLERLLSTVHLKMFRRKSFGVVDTLAFALRSVPHAMYSARYAMLASLVLSLSCWTIGMYSQHADTDFFHTILGDSYYQTTVDNINSGNPMGIYGSVDSFYMFIEIFSNNFLVSMRLYFTGLLTFVGPLSFIVNNWVKFGAFDMFFVQNGLAAEAFIVPNEHGALELSSIIINGGAALLLGAGWLFPGRLTRRQALVRSARHSMLVFMSTLPVIFIAAFIESYVTRHTEWPMPAKLAIIFVSLFFIVGYYVVLPVIAKRHHHNS